MFINYLTRKTLSLLIIIVFSFSTINGQIVINKPVLGFTEVCSSPSFNTYSLSFTVSPVGNIINGNVFNVELSNSYGVFTNPILLTSSTVISSPLSFSFEIPTNLSGTGFRIRIRSTSPASTSLQSNAFSINYAMYNQPYTINNNISTQSFCGGTNYTITTDAGTNSPLNFPSLSYIWYKNGIEIAGQTTSTLVTSEAGVYYSKINYGTCSSEISKSNLVTLSAAAPQTLAITSAGNQTVLCGTTGIVLTSSLTSNLFVYQWYKNNVPIGTNSPSYTAIELGNYFLKIANNSCITPSNTIAIVAQDFTASLNLPTSTTLLPGQNLIIQTSTTAANPSYKWFRNSVELTGQVASSITVTTPGIYKAIVKQNTGCVSEKELIINVSYPTAYSLIIKNSAGYISCEKTSETLTLDSFTANTTVNVLTATIPITYKWLKNNVIVLGQNANSITVSNFTDSGIYKLKATLANGFEIESNPITVKLKFNENPIINTPDFLCNANPTVLLVSSVTNSAYTYSWFKSGSNTVIGSNSSYLVSIAGDYFVKVANDGCEVLSNTVSVKKADESLISNQEETIVLNNDEPITITISGADSYNWTASFSNLVNQTNSYIVNQEGTLTVTARLGSCVVIKTYTITKSTKVFSSLIPNAITPNNDGTNDTWILPEEFAYKDDIEIIIFSSKNEIIHQTKNYLNDWPKLEIASNKVYFYKILKNESVLEKGTLSVLK